MNRSKIDWPFQPLYTWNPAIGCERDCFGGKCWAKNLNKRFKFVDDFNKVNYLDIEKSVENMPKKPSFIFVGSMSDICFWDHGFMRDILCFVRENNKHTFILLTKDSTVYRWFVWPKNTIIGFTITGKESPHKRKKQYSYLMRNIEHESIKTLLSIEPVLGTVDDIPESIDYIIVGALKGNRPKKEWIDSIRISNSYQKIYWKKNLI